VATGRDCEFKGRVPEGTDDAGVKIICGIRTGGDMRPVATTGSSAAAFLCFLTGGRLCADFAHKSTIDACLFDIAEVKVSSDG
jgi:hypothetical protein